MTREEEAKCPLTKEQLRVHLQVTNFKATERRFPASLCSTVLLVQPRRSLRASRKEERINGYQQSWTITSSTSTSCLSRICLPPWLVYLWPRNIH